MDMHSHQAYERLMGMRAEVIEEHAIALAKLRESLQRLVNEFLKLIRLSYSLGYLRKKYPAREGLVDFLNVLSSLLNIFKLFM